MKIPRNNLKTYSDLRFGVLAPNFEKNLPLCVKESDSVDSLRGISRLICFICILDSKCHKIVLIRVFPYASDHYTWTCWCNRNVYCIVNGCYSYLYGLHMLQIHKYYLLKHKKDKKKLSSCSIFLTYKNKINSFLTIFKWWYQRMIKLIFY